MQIDSSAGTQVPNQAGQQVQVQMADRLVSLKNKLYDKGNKQAH